MKIVSIAIGGSGEVLLDNLHPLQGDLVEMTDANRAKLKKEIVDTGFAFTPHVWRNPADEKLYLLDGHQRISVLKDLKADGYAIPLIPVSFINAATMEEAKRRILQARSQYGHMTEQGLANFSVESGFKIEDIKVSFDFPSVDMEKFKDLFAQATLAKEVEVSSHTRVTGLTDQDEIPEVQETTIQLGEVFQLGNHRLVCGDSTDPCAVDLLTMDQKVHMILTDPPWNVNYGASQNSGGWGKERRQILNDHMEAGPWAEFLGKASSNFARIALPGAPLYCVMSAQEWPAIHKALQLAGFHWSSTIIWAKDRLVLSRKDYHTQYEPIWYGWSSEAARIAPLEDRKQTDLWSIPRPHKSELHPTMKPVELLERAILNSSAEGDMVADLFGGSGSTLIACEKVGRNCLMMELDPKYCQVIIERWEAFTGRTVERIAGPPQA